MTVARTLDAAPAPTPERLTRHELIGLSATVADAPNPDLVGVAGQVVDETRRTLVLSAGGSTSRVPKRTTTFAFELPGSPATTVRVAGATLVASPARRTEAAPRPGGDDRWR
jgi:ribonuclease P protein subunit POP4